MANNDIPERIRLRFQHLADDLCEKAGHSGRERICTIAAFQKILGKLWREGVIEHGLDAEAAERYALRVFRPDSFLERSSLPLLLRLLFGHRWRHVRDVLMIGAVVMWMDAYFRSDGAKNGLEIGWVQSLSNLGRYVLDCIGGLCALAQLCVRGGLQPRALALCKQSREFLRGALVDRVGQVGVPVLLALGVTLLIIQRNGVPQAGSTGTIAPADRIAATDSSGPATVPVTGPRANEPTNGVSSPTKGEGGPLGADRNQAESGLTAKTSTLVPSFAKEEKGPALPDGPKLASRTAAGSNTVSISAGAATPITGPKPKATGGVAPLAKEGSGVAVADHSKPVIGIPGSHYRDASGFYRINPAVGGPLPPTGSSVVGPPPPVVLSVAAPASAGFSEVPPASARLASATAAFPASLGARPAAPTGLRAVIVMQ